MSGISLKRTAYHEAGHAVMSLFLRCRFQHVSIVPDTNRNSLGQTGTKGERAYVETYHQAEPLTRNRIMAEKYILVALAGIAAERILTGRKIKAGSYQDGLTAWYYMDQLVYEEDEVKAYSEWLLARAENLLRLQANWFAVETLANKLLMEKYIGSKRAHEIIRAAWKDSVPQFKNPPEE